MLNEIALVKAREYYEVMQVLYGNLFISQFNGMTNLDRIEQIISGAFSPLSEQQFEYGMAALNAKASQGGYCPTLAEFKSWAVSGSWWSIEEAWARVCDHTKNPKVRLTTLAHYVFSQVSDQIISGNMKGAKSRFDSLYSDLMAKAQMKGESQKWHEPLVQIESKFKPSDEPTPSQKIGINDEQKQIIDKTKQLMNEGFSWGDAFKKAQLEIRGVVKNLNKTETNQAKETQKETKWETVDIAHVDPFDNTEQYKVNLKQDGKPVPPAVRTWEMTLAQMVEKRRAMMQGGGV